MVRITNVDADLSLNPREWPFEALVTVITRGLIPDWQPIFREMRARPWGRLAKRVEAAIALEPDDPASKLFGIIMNKARSAREELDRQAVATQVREAISRSGKTQQEFAANIGTSASRLSTYANGSVIPSAAMLLRILDESLQD